LIWIFVGRSCLQIVFAVLQPDFSGTSRAHFCEDQQVCNPATKVKIRSDEDWMEDALAAAQRAFDPGEVPVGAVVVLCGEIVGTGWNRNLTDHDPTAHAEIVAMRSAGIAIGNHRLISCELFATIEPCAMCAGAMVHARLRRLVYGANDSKAGAVHSVIQVLNHPQLNHRMEVRGGVLADRCAELLQCFFRDRR
jgi:tRNA(adenine34) deaminase